MSYRTTPAFAIGGDVERTGDYFNNADFLRERRLHHGHEAEIMGLPWRPIELCDRDGQGRLCFGIHDRSPPDAARGVKPGDHWFAILLWDIWRPSGGWVFAKDGAPAWSQPTHTIDLTPPKDLAHD